MSSFKKSTPSFIAAYAGPQTPQPDRGAVTRRAALRGLAAAVLATCIPLLDKSGMVLADDIGGLPPGAAHFTQVVASQRKWMSLRAAFDNRKLEESEWESIRGLLRTTYAVSADMEFLAKRWRDASLREAGLAVIKRFRTEVKALDKPALARDAEAFLTGYDGVGGLYDEFFARLRDDSVGDMPDEL